MGLGSTDFAYGSLIEVDDEVEEEITVEHASQHPVCFFLGFAILLIISRNDVFPFLHFWEPLSSTWLVDFPSF